MTVEEFKKNYPQFVDIDDTIIKSKMDFFNAMYSSTSFGMFGDLAEGLYVSHILTVDLSMAIDKDNIENAITSPGLISSEKTPEFSLDYAIPDCVMKASIDDAFFLNTEYGKRFLSLLKKITPLSMVVKKQCLSY